MSIVRRSIVTGVILLIFGGLAGLVTFWVIAGDMDEDDRQLTRRILQAREAPAPVTDIYPGQWDYVCYLDPYSFPSNVLPRRLPETIGDLDYSPNDRWVDEERWGIVFVTTRTAQARVFLVDNHAIYRIEGPECAMRETVTFHVETVVALNKTYIRLTVADAPR